MKATLGVGLAAGLIIFAARAQGGEDGRVAQAPQRAGPILEWNELAHGLAGRPAIRAAAAGPATAEVVVATAPAVELDVVDAHWMALTMWGEARGEGEEAMRAVGHVIDNRRRAGGADADFVTDTVSEAFQFSCWNPGDPNREAMLRVDSYPPGSHDHAMWLAARRIADEILAGRSHDPTGGALFYHGVDVAPNWSRGMVPVRRIGGHVFFRTARQA